MYNPHNYFTPSLRPSCKLMTVPDYFRNPEGVEPDRKVLTKRLVGDSQAERQATFLTPAGSFRNVGSSARTFSSGVTVMPVCRPEPARPNDRCWQML